MKDEVPVIDLNCLATAPRAKWEKRIERVKEGNWIHYINGSKNAEEGVKEGWVSHKGRI